MKITKIIETCVVESSVDCLLKLTVRKYQTKLEQNKQKGKIKVLFI